jgi:hypothetical protein
MEIKINKNFFIKFGIVVALCFASFCFGYSRLSGISGIHGELEQRIVLAGNTADSILDELGIARPTGQSAADTGYAILRGIQKLSKSNETARVCLDEIKREVELTEQNAEIIKQSFDGVSDAIDYGWRVTENQALAYERIVGALQQFDNNSSKNE